MPVFVFYRVADGLVVGWRESDYAGDPAAEAASRGTGIAYVQVPVRPKPGHTAKIANGVLEEIPIPVVVVPDPDAELADAIQTAATLQELKDALLGKTGKAGIVKGRSK